MYNTIKLAREALQLFVQSLPFGCQFNICSYGTDHEFMFKTSVPLNDENLNYATNNIAEF